MVCDLPCSHDDPDQYHLVGASETAVSIRMALVDSGDRNAVADFRLSLLLRDRAARGADGRYFTASKNVGDCVVCGRCADLRRKELAAEGHLHRDAAGWCLCDQSAG